MSNWHFKAVSITDLEAVTDRLKELATTFQYFTFVGDLGAGKTTLIKQWMLKLGVNDPVTSPTFSVINEYRYEEGAVYHMDLYRLKEVEELLEIGIEEYLYSDAICIFEWPNLVLELLDKDYIQVNIENIEGVREITIHTVTP